MLEDSERDYPRSVAGVAFSSEEAQSTETKPSRVAMDAARNDLDDVRARRPNVDLADVMPVGADALVDLIRRHLDNGLSKFVLRPVTVGTSLRDELRWLADTVLPLQT